jgi:hypothetical protein
VRVARALEALPGISAAFARGAISYSKVRAMTRVATDANEDVLLNVALHGTAAHVERLVRKYRWTERRESARRSMKQHAERELDCFYDDNGTFVLHARLPAELGALVSKALEAAVEELQNDSTDTVAASADDVSAETSDAPETDRRTAAAERADALVRIAERALAGGNRRVSTADRYQVVVHVDHALLSSGPRGDYDPHDGEPHRCEPRCCELASGPALAADTARRLACDATLVGLVERDGEPLDIGRRTRAIPPALDRALRARDGGCRFPGCTRTRVTEGHHVVHWADGGETKLANLVTLCRFHHRLVHEGEFGLRATDDGLFVFTGPDGRRLTESGSRCFRGNMSGELGIRQLIRDTGVMIDERTCRSRWLGERMDMRLAIEDMQRRRRPPLAAEDPAACRYRTAADDRAQCSSDPSAAASVAGASGADASGADMAGDGASVSPSPRA